MVNRIKKYRAITKASGFAGSLAFDLATHEPEAVVGQNGLLEYSLVWLAIPDMDP